MDSAEEGVMGVSINILVIIAAIWVIQSTASAGSSVTVRVFSRRAQPHRRAPGDCHDPSQRVQGQHARHNLTQIIGI